MNQNITKPFYVSEDLASKQTRASIQISDKSTGRIADQNGLGASQQQSIKCLRDTRLDSKFLRDHQAQFHAPSKSKAKNKENQPMAPLAMRKAKKSEITVTTNATTTRCSEPFLPADALALQSVQSINKDCNQSLAELEQTKLDRPYSRKSDVVKPPL